jgi:zinc transporter ZupT
MPVSETPTKIVVKTSTSNVPTIEETPVVDRESKQKSAWQTLAIGFFCVLFLGGLSIWGLLFYTKRKTGTD